MHSKVRRKLPDERHTEQGLPVAVSDDSPSDYTQYLVACVSTGPLLESDRHLPWRCPDRAYARVGA